MWRDFGANPKRICLLAFRISLEYRISIRHNRHSIFASLNRTLPDEAWAARKLEIICQTRLHFHALRQTADFTLDTKDGLEMRI